jgi:hypothetical protein
MILLLPEFAGIPLGNQDSDAHELPLLLDENDCIEINNID